MTSTAAIDLLAATLHQIRERKGPVLLQRPAGYVTADEYGAREGIAPNVAGVKLRRACDSGRMQRVQALLVNSDGRQRATWCYAPKKNT